MRNKAFTEFTSPSGTPHKIPVPTRDQQDCPHEMYGSYSFDMMLPPFCMTCGKPAEGKRAEESLVFYQSLIDDANARAQRDLDTTGSAFFYTRIGDGPYRQEYRMKPKSNRSILGILYDVFIGEPLTRHYIEEAKGHRRK